jgi:Ran GTPase-activating protein (RanGAP) involved in mRNA processing and transport
LQDVTAAAGAHAAAGVELIAEALAFNSSLLCLDLSDNKIGNAGALALAEALHSNKTLAELQLSDNKIGARMIGCYNCNASGSATSSAEH